MQRVGGPSVGLIGSSAWHVLIACCFCVVGAVPRARLIPRFSRFQSFALYVAVSFMACCFCDGRVWGGPSHEVDPQVLIHTEGYLHLPRISWMSCAVCVTGRHLSRFYHAQLSCGDVGSGTMNATNKHVHDATQALQCYTLWTVNGKVTVEWYCEAQVSRTYE